MLRELFFDRNYQEFVKENSGGRLFVRTSAYDAIDREIYRAIVQDYRRSNCWAKQLADAAAAGDLQRLAKLIAVISMSHKRVYLGEQEMVDPTDGYLDEIQQERLFLRRGGFDNVYQMFEAGLVGIERSRQLFLRLIHE